MSGLTAGPSTRFNAILSGGYGADGSLGPDAQLRSIPVGWFRPGLQHVPVHDPQTPTAAVDRAYKMRWLRARDEIQPRNILDSVTNIVMTMTLEIGYLHGVGLGPWVNLIGGETALGAITELGARAQSDAERIVTAFMCSQLYQGGGGTDPYIVKVERVGDSMTRPLEAGRQICETVFAITMQRSQTYNYDP